MHLAPNMYKIITLKANAKNIITWKCMWHHICAKLWIWRQKLRKLLLENAYDTTYVQNCYFEGKCQGNCHFKMHLAPNMYKIVTLKANAQKIITLKCISHQICTKSLLWRQIVRKLLLENAFGTIYVLNYEFGGKC